MEQHSFSFNLLPGQNEHSEEYPSPLDSTLPIDIWLYERRFYAEGCRLVAGVDEAGRGPLAGPVIAACVVLPRDFPCAGITDSKRLSQKQREQGYDRITGGALMFAVGVAETVEIDAINILRATHAAMGRAVSGLRDVPHVVLVDGLPVPRLADCRQMAIVSGDALSVSIAAASIVAKVTRDRMMRDYSLIYPEYGFERHKGYGSSFHLDALHKFGPCPIHRRSFSPVASLIEPVLR